MPNTFVEIGPFWVNLDLVSIVELVGGMAESPSTDTQAARVHFTSGKPLDLSEPTHIETLLKWLRKHKAK